MDKDEKYAIYVYYDIAGKKLEPAPLSWHELAAGYLRAYLPGPNGLAESAIDLVAQSAKEYIGAVTARAFNATMPGGNFFDLVDAKSWLELLGRPAKAGLGKSTATEIYLPDMGGAIASITGVLVSSADLGEMIESKNIHDPTVSAIAATVLKESIRWHALCFKARMKNVTSDLQEELTDVVARALTVI